jgi:hypothetical protein
MKMNEYPGAETTVDSSENHGSAVDHGRRKLGVGGSAVLLSLSSKSAVAGWGSCTGSELASGNLSKAGTANPCGCSPGFWWNSNGALLRGNAPSLAAYPFTLKFNTFFGRNFLSNPNKTFQDCGPNGYSSYTKTAPTSTAMHAIAALLNAAYYGTRYPVSGMQTAAQVKASFQLAFDNNALAAFVTLVDVYKNGVWCNGADHGGV